MPPRGYSGPQKSPIIGVAVRSKIDTVIQSIADKRNAAGKGGGSNGHAVNIESSLADWKTAIDAIGHKLPGGVAMHIPATDNGKFPRLARGYAYQRPGKRVFYMRPALMKNQGNYNDAEHQRRQIAYKARQQKIADSRKSYGLGSGKVVGWSMPATEKNGRAYTMVHEMGHLVDGEHGHTGNRMGMGGTGSDVWRRNREELSSYGRTSAKEGYAEAAAQYFLGGKGSNAAADDYARTYGW